jgi:DNA-binding NarL/FixJ family response regulator
VPQGLRRRGVTAPEFEVLQLFADRPSNADIADRLHLSVRTVKNHVASLLRKLDARSRADLQLLAVDGRRADRSGGEDGWSPPMTRSV